MLVLELCGIRRGQAPSESLMSASAAGGVLEAQITV